MKKLISQQYDKTFISMNDIIQLLLVLWAFLFSQSFQMYKNKDVLQKQKEKKKRNSPLPLSPVTTTTKTNRWLETAVKPRCISLRCGRQTRGNKNLNFLKSCPLFSKNLFLFLNIGQALATTPPLSTVFPEQRRT